MTVNIAEMEHCADPNTPQWMLPRHLRAGDNAVEEACRRQALRLAIGFLSAKQRQALHMRYDLGFSYRELSSQLGISRSAAEKRIKRSQQSLKMLVDLCVLVQREMSKSDNA